MPTKVYINLVCIDRNNVRNAREYVEVTEVMVLEGSVDVVHGRKWPIDFDEIAANLPATSLEKVVLVEGAPGVGKSTFAWEFCRRWARGKIAQEYQLVLLLRLREERISNAKGLKDLICHPSENVHTTVIIKELEESLGISTLIILEGFDELPETCRTVPSVFLQLILGELLPLATVMVTSRPWATQVLHEECRHRIFQHVEILGFTEQQISLYIKSVLSANEARDFEEYLENHPQIRKSMYIPLNSAIVVTVYEESQASGCAMPTTLTELYTSLTLILLQRYLRGHPEYKTGCKYLQTFNDLPHPVNAKLYEVCGLAYSGIVGNTTSSVSTSLRHSTLPANTSDQVQLIFRDLPSDFDDLGLMDSVTELYVTRGTVSSHNFLHLTFQEFFAAVYICRMTPAQQVEHFKRHEEGRLKVVLRFLAGLNKFNCFSIEEIASTFFQTPSTREGGRYLISCDAAVSIDLIQWLFEAQSDDVLEHVLGRKTIEFQLSSTTLPLDYYSLGYCISHSQSQWVFDLTKIDKTEVMMLAAGAGTTSEPRGRVVGLRGLYPYDLTHCLNMLFTRCRDILHLRQLCFNTPVLCDPIPWPCISALRVLQLRSRTQTEWKLNNLLPNLSLESLAIDLCIGDCDLVYEDCVALGDHIVSTSSLKELGIFVRILSITDVYDKISHKKGVEAITAALAGNHSLPLERLEFHSNCTFTATAGDSLAHFIKNTTTLEYLTLKYLTLKLKGFDSMEGITAALASNLLLPLKRLEFKCTFTATAGDSLAQFIANTTTLKYLSIEYTGVDRMEAITAALASNHLLPLKKLNLECNCTFTATAGDSLAQFITNTTTLNYLSIKNKGFDRMEGITAALASNHSLPLKELKLKCTFTATAGDSLAQFITNTTTLKYLSMVACTFSAHALLVVARAIHHNSILQTENISLTVNGDNEVKDLAQLLAEFSNLDFYVDKCNCVGDAGALALAQALHHNSTLTMR